jgi:hypothetical protein
MAQQFNNVKMNALSEYKLRLLAPPQQGGQKPANLSVGVYKNNPRIVVRTNVPNDKDYGKITAALDSFAFFTLMHVVERVANGPNDTKEILNNQSTFVAGKKFDTPIVVSKIQVGKDKEGVVFIAVTAKDRPMIKFEFCQDEWHYLTHGDGTPWTKAEYSQIRALGWRDALKELVPFILISDYVEPEQRNNNGNGGGNNGGGGGNRGGNNNGGGWNNNRNNGGGNAGSDDGSSDDDLPF